MKRFSLLVLLLAAASAPLVSGQPLYHCSLTGIDSWFCSCLDGPAQTCCPQCASNGTEESDSPGTGWGAACSDCCEITLYRCLGTKPESDRQSPTDVGPAAVVALQSFRTPLATILCGSHCRAGPSGSVPAFILNMSFLC